MVARLRHTEHFLRSAYRASKSGNTIFHPDWPQVRSAAKWLKSVDRPSPEHLSLISNLGYLAKADARLPLHYRILWLHDAIIASQAIGDLRIQADHLSSLGEVLEEVGHNADSLDAYAQAEAVNRVLGNLHNYGAMLVAQARVLERIGRPTEAITFRQQALDVTKELGDQNLEIQQLSHLGLFYVGLGRFSESRIFLDEAIAKAQASSDRRSESIALHHRALLFFDTHNYEAALVDARASLRLCRELGDQDGDAVEMALLGEIFTHMERFEESLECYDIALVNAFKQRNTDSQAGLQINIGAVYARLGVRLTSQRYFEQGLKAFESLGNLRGMCVALNNIGNIQRLSNEHAKARSSHARAVLLARRIGDAAREAQFTLALAKDHIALGRSMYARRLLSRALAIHAELPVEVRTEIEMTLRRTGG